MGRGVISELGGAEHYCGLRVMQVDCQVSRAGLCPPHLLCCSPAAMATAAASLLVKVWQVVPVGTEMLNATSITHHCPGLQHSRGSMVSYCTNEALVDAALAWMRSYQRSRPPEALATTHFLGS